MRVWTAVGGGEQSIEFPDSCRDCYVLERLRPNSFSSDERLRETAAVCIKALADTATILEYKGPEECAAYTVINWLQT